MCVAPFQLAYTTSLLPRREEAIAGRVAGLPLHGNR